VKPEIYNKLNLFVGNTRAMSGFTWQSAYVKHIAAFLYTQENRQVDIAAIQNCYSFIKNVLAIIASDNASETKNNLLNVTLFTIVSSILAQEAANTI